MSDKQEESIKQHEEREEKVHFIEDLEERQNSSAPVTTLAIGEENGGGW